MSRGEAACFISHILLWEKCVELDEPILVLEDDAAIKDDLILLLPWLKEQVKKHGYIKLFSDKNPHSMTTTLEKTAYYKLLKWNKGICYTVAYIISPDSAKKLLVNLNKIDIPVDNYMDRFWEHGVEQISLFPFPCSHRVVTSNITRNKQTKHRSITKKLNKLINSSLDDIKRYLHNRKFSKNLSKDKPDE